MEPSLPRRSFLKTSLKAGVLLPVLGTSLFSCSAPNPENKAETDDATRKLNILILGGTSFLGPHQVAYALSRGHSVATFTRGKTQPTIHQELFKEVEQLIGDREDNLSALENRTWDLVIDNSGRKVEWTKKTATLLADKSELYLYTSSTGVFYPYLGNDIGKQTELVLEMPEGIEDEGEQMEYAYGIMKANSERETIQAFGKDRSIIVRPTYMIGPADKSDRFIHWPIRLSQGGETLVPGKTDDPVQYIDVRDVAEWMIRLAEQKKAGTYHAVGPEKPQTMREFVAQAQQAFPIESEFVYIDDYQFLADNEVHYLVPWIPPVGDNYGSARINNQAAIAAGLRFRPIKESMLDIHSWWYSDALTEERRIQFEKHPSSVLMREADILEQWKARQRE